MNMETNYDLIARQAILSSKGIVQAYELLARDELSSSTDPFLASARVLVKAFTSFRIEELLDNKIAFINFTDSFFDERSIELFPSERIVPEFTLTASPDPQFLEKLQYLKKAGFRLAIDRFSGKPWEIALLRWINYVKIDFLGLDLEILPNLLKTVRSQPYTTKAPILIATRVETRQAAEFAFAAGMDWAQGYYFTRPQLITNQHASSSQRNIFHLLNLLMGDNSLEEIEDGFRRDPALTVKLLRYLNSAGMRRTQAIDSIRRALLLLGRAPLQRWLTLLMFADQGSAKASLLVMATNRARLAELLRERSTALDQSPAALHRSFLVGMLSLLDALFDRPLSALLAELQMDSSISLALLQREGEDGLLLQLIDAIERTDPTAMQQYAETAGLTLSAINSASLEALAWSAAQAQNAF